jgi:hypothetical protein
VNDELERIGKEEVVALFNVLSLHLPGGIKECKEALARITGFVAEILIRYLPNTKQEF